MWAAPTRGGEPKSTYWQGDPAEPNDWFEPKNWTAGLPGPGTWTYIDNGGTAVIHALPILEGPDGPGRAVATASMLYIGDTKGGAVMQTSGPLEVTSDIYLNRYGVSWGAYGLVDGLILADNIHIGSSLTWDTLTDEPASGYYGGRFQQSGGSVVLGDGAITSGRLNVGLQVYEPPPLEGDLPAAGPGDLAPDWPGALYELSGELSKLSTTRTDIGGRGVGKFVQTGGAHGVARELMVGGGGWYCGSTCCTKGTYVLSGGELSAQFAYVGSGGNGRFLQNGGTAKVDKKLQVGADWSWWIVDCIIPADGHYLLEDEGVLQTGSTDVGVGGVGEFVQSGGDHEIADLLRVGGHPEWQLPFEGFGGDAAPSGAPEPEDSWAGPGPPHGSYMMGGGSLSANRMEIGPGYWYYPRVGMGYDWSKQELPTATFTQTGGDVEVRGELQVRSARYALSDGTLTAESLLLSGPFPYNAGQFRQTGGTCTITSLLRVGAEPWPVHLPDEALEPQADGAGNADVRPPWWRGAQYTLAGGELFTGYVHVGSNGPGRFVQTDGTHKIGYSLLVGGGAYHILAEDALADPTLPDVWPEPIPWPYRQGSYELSGGELSARSVHVGQWGCGQFVQSGGTASVGGTLQVGGNWWWWPRPIHVPLADPAETELSSGRAPEYWHPANGTYALRDGVLKTQRTEIGIGGSGWFSQSGGEHLVAGTLRVGGYPYRITLANDDGSIQPAGGPNVIWPPYPGPCRGRYAMSGGVLAAGRIEIAAGYTPWLMEPVLWDGTRGAAYGKPEPAIIAPWMPATFRQTGGEVNVEHDLSVRGGSVELHDGTLSVADLCLGGWYYYDSSHVRQYGGEVDVRGGLYIGADCYVARDTTLAEDEHNARMPWWGYETYSLCGGQLQAAKVRIAGLGRSMLVQSGGELSVPGAIEIAGRCASYSFYRGTTTATRVDVGGPNTSSGTAAPGGRLYLGGREAELTVRDALAFGPQGQFGAAPGSTVHMNGADLENTSRDPVALLGLDSVRLIFTIGPEDDQAWETYEVAGKDLGFVRHGWWQNFQLHTLQVGGEDVGELKLVDEFDNQPDYDPEALYVRYLRVGPDSSLDLNKLNLYYLDAWIDDDAVILNGTAERFDEPAWAPRGDLDFDGCVNRPDFVRLRAGFGRGNMARADGDLDGDGDIDAFDYLALKRGIGQGQGHGHGGASAPIPEPATLALVAAGAVALLRRKRR